MCVCAPEEEQPRANLIFLHTVAEYKFIYIYVLKSRADSHFLGLEMVFNKHKLGLQPILQRPSERSANHEESV